MNAPSSFPRAHTIGPPIQPDATLQSTPDTILWGYIAANLPPALTIQSGQTVAIELSHQGWWRRKIRKSFSALMALRPAMCWRMPRQYILQ